MHLSIGQEASAVGACWPLGPTDVITSTHRGHGHCLAKGLDPLGMFAELMAQGRRARTAAAAARCTSPIRRSASSAPTGSSPPACRSRSGAATAAQLRADGSVAVAFFGDGAVAQGAFHEAVNLAAVWQLPVIFFCENNGYAEFSPASDQHAAPLERRAAGYGVDYVAVDGNDVVATAAAMHDGGRRRSAPDGGPVIVEAATYRWHGHYEGDPQRYRIARGAAGVGGARPAASSTRAGSATAGVADDAIAALEPSVARRARRRRRRRPAARPSPAAATLFDFVVRAATRAPRAAGARRRRAGVPHDGRDPRRARGRARRRRAGVRRRHRRRRPAATCSASRAASTTVRRPRPRHADLRDARSWASASARRWRACDPVVELMYLDFVGVCLDQLLNQAAKLPFMTGGAAQMALTVRTQFGAGRSSGSQHSQSLEALLAHIPGLTVVMPSTPADTYGLLRAAIQDPNPVSSSRTGCSTA